MNGSALPQFVQCLALTSCFKNVHHSFGKHSLSIYCIIAMPDIGDKKINEEGTIHAFTELMVSFEKPAHNNSTEN